MSAAKEPVPDRSIPAPPPPPFLLCLNSPEVRLKVIELLIWYFNATLLEDSIAILKTRLTENDLQQLIEQSACLYAATNAEFPSSAETHLNTAPDNARQTVIQKLTQHGAEALREIRAAPETSRARPQTLALLTEALGEVPPTLLKARVGDTLPINDQGIKGLRVAPHAGDSYAAAVLVAGDILTEYRCHAEDPEVPPPTPERIKEAGENHRGLFAGWASRVGSATREAVQKDEGGYLYLFRPFQPQQDVTQQDLTQQDVTR